MVQRDSGVGESAAGTRVDGATWAMAVCCVLAVPFYLVASRGQWFYQDEFALLTNPAESIDDLFRPHNVHLMVPARILYRINWDLFGLTRYEPYQIWSILAHVALAAMIYSVLRRVGVGPWLAATLGVLFLAFGKGHSNITWAFQVGFAGSVTTGYAQLLLADHDGTNRRRDALALLAGFLAVTGSAPGQVMVGVVGLAIFLRRGWRAAAFQTLPLIAFFLIWRRLYGRPSESASLGQIPGFVGDALFHLGERAALHPLAAGLIVLLAVAGLVLAGRHVTPTQALRRQALPLSLAVGGLVFIVFTAYGRAHRTGADFASFDRYSHILLALLLPIVGVGLQGLVERWGRLLMPLIVVLLSAVPANLGAIEVRENRHATAGVIMGVAQSPLLEEMHPDNRPFESLTGKHRITVGWLLELHRSGEIPTTRIDRETQKLVDEALAFDVAPTGGRRMFCEQWPRGEQIVLSAGESQDFVGALRVQTARDGEVLRPREIRKGRPHRVTAMIDDIEVTLAADPDSDPLLC